MFVSRIIPIAVGITVLVSPGWAITVRRIDFVFDGQRPPYDLDRLVEVQPGHTLTEYALVESLHNIYQTGLCEQVWVQRRSSLKTSNTIDLVFFCRLRPWIKDIQFVYAKTRTFSPRHLQRHMTELARGMPYTPGLLRRWTQDIESFYREAGFANPHVEIRFEITDPRRKAGVLKVWVDEGQPQAIKHWVWANEPPCMTLQLAVEDVLDDAQRWQPAVQVAIRRAVQRVRQAGYWTAWVETQWRDGVVYLEGRCGPRVWVQLVGWPDSLSPPVQWWERVEADGEGLNDTVFEDIQEDLLRQLHVAGYPHARVEWERLPPFTDMFWRVRFRVDRGAPLRVVTITWEGLPEELKAETRAWGPGRIWIPEAFEQWLQRFQYALRRRGYDPVRFQWRVIRQTGEGVVLHVWAEVGPRYTVADIQFVGNTVWSDEELIEGIPLRPGYPFDPRQVQISEQRIRDRYFRAGYFHVRVESRMERILEAPPRIRVVFRVVEGMPTRVDTVIFRGLRRTHASAVYRLVPLRPGDVLRPDHLELLQNRLYWLGVFDRVTIRLPLPQQMRPEEDLIIEVREGRPIRFNYGLGYQERDRLRGILSVVHRNFLGRAYRFYSLFRFSFVNWRLLGSIGGLSIGSWPIEWQGAVEMEFRDRPAFDFVRNRIALQGLFRFRPRAWFSGFFELSTTRLKNVIPDLIVDPTAIAREFESLRLARVSWSWVMDTRDSVLNATRGMFLSLTNEWSLRVWGSEVDFIKLTAQWNAYLPLTRWWVAAVSSRLGWGERLDGAPALPISQRFFAGGSRSHRGFGPDMLGPLSPRTRTPLGGDSFFITSVEQRWTVWRRWGLVLFFDMGNVFTDAPVFRWRAWRKAGGIGIRYMSPFGPLGIDLAWLLDRRPGERGFRWFVLVGQEF